MANELWGVFWNPTQGAWDIDELANTAQKSRSALRHDPDLQSNWVFVGHADTWEGAHALKDELIADGIGQ